MSSANSRDGLRRALLIGGLMVAFLATASGAWWLLRPKNPQPDMVAVLEVNNRGIGHMEQFNYDEAIGSFKEVTQLAPDWMPGQINLGIALMNKAGYEGTKASTEKAATASGYAAAVQVFERVLKREPNNPYALFCLGLIAYQQGDFERAAPYFEAVTHADPTDAAAWHWLGLSTKRDANRASQCYRRAIELDPQLSPALYNFYLLQQRLPEGAKAAYAEYEALHNGTYDLTTRGNGIGVKYSEPGPYAEAIGRVADPTRWPQTGPIPLFHPSDRFRVELAPGARWATSADFHGDALAEFRARVRDRFGATLVVLDYDHDGKPDLLLLGAVVKDGQVHDLLLHNEGNGRFRDVTAETGLDQVRPSLGCCVGDFDNDGYPDVFITGAGEQHLFRNVPDGNGGRRFEDVTAAMGLAQLKTVCLGATFVDLDHDGDLDLVVAQYTTMEHLADALQGDKPPPGMGLAVYINVGEAPGIKESNSTKAKDPLHKPAFRPAKEVAPASQAGATWSIDGLLGGPVPAVSLAVADLDRDHDLDLIALADGSAPDLVLNHRLLRFNRVALPSSLVPAGRWNGALVMDAFHEGQSDLFLVGPDHRPLLLLNRSNPAQPATKWFQPGATNSPPLLQAQAIDLDLDGWTDVVGLSAQRKPVLLHNDGHRLVHRREALGADAAWPNDLVAVTVGDFSGHGLPDLLVWSETEGLQLHVNQGNRNHGLRLTLTGLRGPDREAQVRCNADGYGVWAMAQAGDLWTGAEYTTLSAGLGQSCQPLWLGLGRHPEADVVRLRWPDNCWQAELNQPADQLVRIVETNRKPGSCPILFAWNGRRFAFVTDFLGAGSVGEMQPDGSTRMPRPEESVKIETHQLAPLDGHFVLKLAEPMSEITYLDRLQLLVLDHPADVSVYPDERFVASGPPVSQDLLAFRRRIFPARARDHRGRDVTQKLREWDRDTVDGFARRSWLGYAEEHWVELDFGDRLAKLGPDEPVILCLAGWTDYAYPDSIWAATQAGVELQPPVLERLGADGKWHTLVADAGFPAGLPRMMTLDVTGKLGGPRCVLRLRTNMQIFWDQIFVAPLLARVRSASAKPQAAELKVTRLEVSGAALSARGCMQEFSPDGRQPTLYDYDRLESVPVSPPAGRVTRFGDVTGLLREADDRFVIFGPGDEVTVRFDARKLPALRPGWTRSFVLRTWGYCKDSGLFTATGETVEPLPFRAMRHYPYEPEEHLPADALEDNRRFSTRQAGGQR
jgi:hypothetical protein